MQGRSRDAKDRWLGFHVLAEGRGGGNYSFIYTAPDAIADSHIVINITARKEGYETAYQEIPITVFIIPPEPINLLCVKLFPEEDPIMEGSTMNFTIYVLFNCDPFPGAVVEMTHRYGAVSNIQDGGGGKFTFTYLAPDSGIDPRDRIHRDRNGSPETWELEKFSHHFPCQCLSS